jgi:hypothetical protein
LASNYELGINFNNPTKNIISAVLKVLNDHEIVMHSEALEFPPSGTRWRTQKTFTASAINAGNYSLQLSFEGQSEIKIRYFSVQ